MTRYGTTDLDFGSYNLDNGRPIRTVQHEVEAILDTGLACLVGVEALGYQFRPIRGFTQLADRTTDSRANVTAWVADDLVGDGALDWIDLTTEWPRPKYPNQGRHEPRSYPRFRVARIPTIGVHQPPPNLDALTIPAQGEGIKALAPVMAPWLRPNWEARTGADQWTAQCRPRIAYGDYNRAPGVPGPGPSTLARAIGTRDNGTTVGDRIDCAVVVGDIEVTNVAYPTRVGGLIRGVRLRSDHGHYFRFTATVPNQWAHIPEENQ